MKDFIFGIQSVTEAITAGHSIDKVLIRSGMRSPFFQTLRVQLKQLGVPIQQVPNEKLDYICQGRNHQGVVAYIAAVPFMPLPEVIARLFEEGKMPLLLALDGVTDVRNFGAMVRTAECMGVHSVVVGAKNTARLGPDAVKTSSGALLHLPVCRENSIAEALAYMKSCGIVIVGCTEKAWKPIHQIDVSVPVCLLMGSEHTGISAEALRLCDESAAIFTKGRIASLNVSVALGMILYETYHQRAALAVE